MSPSIDLNCDVGEGFARDAELLALASSANIACGGHAGDKASMHEAVRLALEHGVGVGAHPGLPDREGFGRRGLSIPVDAIAEQAAGQILALARVALIQGATLSHVKLHGALYNEAATGGGMAEALLAMITRSTECRILFALAGSRLAGLARRAGFVVAEEAFPDRGYRADGSLVARGEAGALIEDPREVARRAVRMALGEGIESVEGGWVGLRADTLCIHGDSANALLNARRVVAALADAGVAVRRFAAR